MCFALGVVVLVSELSENMPISSLYASPFKDENISRQRHSADLSYYLYDLSEGLCGIICANPLYESAWIRRFQFSKQQESAKGRQWSDTNSSI